MIQLKSNANSHNISFSSNKKQKPLSQLEIILLVAKYKKLGWFTYEYFLKYGISHDRFRQLMVWFRKVKDVRSLNDRPKSFRFRGAVDKLRVYDSVDEEIEAFERIQDFYLKGIVRR